MSRWHSPVCPALCWPFTVLSSVNTHSNSLREVLVFPPVHRGTDESTERLSDSLKVTVLPRTGRRKLHTQRLAEEGVTVPAASLLPGEPASAALPTVGLSQTPRASQMPGRQQGQCVGLAPGPAGRRPHPRKWLRVNCSDYTWEGVAGMGAPALRGASNHSR